MGAQHQSLGIRCRGRSRRASRNRRDDPLNHGRRRHRTRHGRQRDGRCSRRRRNRRPGLHRLAGLDDITGSGGRPARGRRRPHSLLGQRCQMRRDRRHHFSGQAPFSGKPVPADIGTYREQRPQQHNRAGRPATLRCGHRESQTGLRGTARDFYLEAANQLIRVQTQGLAVSPEEPRGVGRSRQRIELPALQRRQVFPADPKAFRVIRQAIAEAFPGRAQIVTNARHARRFRRFKSLARHHLPALLIPATISQTWLGQTLRSSRPTHTIGTHRHAIPNPEPTAASIPEETSMPTTEDCRELMWPSNGKGHQPTINLSFHKTIAASPASRRSLALYRQPMLARPVQDRLTQTCLARRIAPDGRQERLERGQIQPRQQRLHR